MKTLAQVEEALKTRYSGPIKSINRFDYIPWEESVYQANEIFGSLGWDSIVNSCEYEEANGVMVNIGDRDNPNYVPRDFKGYKSIVAIRVRVWDEEHGIVVTTEHGGVGFGNIQGMGNNNPMDNACKSAKSDGISTALKHYGDALGLFLYRKDTVQSSQTSNNKSQAPSNNNSNGSKYPVTEKRASYIKSNFKLSDAQVDEMDNKVAGTMLDRLWKEKRGVQEILVEFGYAPAGKPVPAGGIPEDEDPF